MKKNGVLNEHISKAISTMGHKDMFLVCDAGISIPEDVYRIDVAVGKNVPGFIETLKVICQELCVEKIIVAKEMESNFKLYNELVGLFGSVEVEKMTHEEFKLLTKEAKVAVRTGEFTPYANIILVCGVVF